MPQVQQVVTYTIDELSPESREKALEKLRVDYPYGDWWDGVYEDAKEIGKLMGFDIDRIYFSGFWSQGDGACFEGSLGYAKGCLKKVKEHAPQDEELHKLAERWQDIQRRYFYQISGQVSQRGHYSHSGCTHFSIDFGEWNGMSTYSTEYDSAEDDVKQIVREFMDWIYKRLEEEYWFLVSDEQVLDMARANEYQFEEDGSLWG